MHDARHRRHVTSARRPKVRSGNIPERWPRQALSCPDRQTLLVNRAKRALLVIIILGATVAPSALGQTASGAANPLQPAQALQRCVDRWNQMKMSFFIRTIGLVQSRPACSITLAHTFTPLKQFGCKPAHLLPGTPKLCLDSQFVFRCMINIHGAYECPQHADGPMRIRAWNARVTNGTLVLDHPPSVKPITPLPLWARAYPYKDGFIFPWSTADRLRPGLTLQGNAEGICEQSSESTSAPQALRCFTPSEIYDPCFPKSIPWRRGVLAACPTTTGSTVFVRFQIQGAVHA